MALFKKICIILTNRSEYAKVKSVLFRLREDKEFDLKILVGGSLANKRYGNAVQEITKDGFSISGVIKTIVDGDGVLDVIKSSGLQMYEEGLFFDSYKPDIAIIIGDRWEVVPLVFVLSMYCIPIAHLQGGEKSGTIDDVFRNVITKYSHIHFTANELCRKEVINLNECPDHVYSIGCPSLDIIKNIDVGDDVDLNKIQEYIKDPFTLSKKDKYFMVMVHPNVTIRSDIDIKIILKTLLRFPNKKIWFYPNEDPFHETITSAITRNREIIKFSHIDMNSFIMLMAHCSCFIGNSSAGIRETASFGVPTINIGDRQIGRERNENTIDVRCDENEIYRAVYNSIGKKYPCKNIYGDGKSSDRIINIIKSYKKLNYKNINISEEK